MAATGLEVFDRSVQKSTEWVNAVARELGSDDRRYAYRVLRAYFHVLRDRLTVDEAAQLAAQLPHLLRGVFYDGWDPSKTPQTYRDRETFLSRLAEGARLPGPADAASAARAATEVLREHVSPARCGTSSTFSRGPFGRCSNPPTPPEFPMRRERPRHSRLGRPGMGEMT